MDFKDTEIMQEILKKVAFTLKTHKTESLDLKDGTVYITWISKK